MLADATRNLHYRRHQQGRSSRHRYHFNEADKFRRPVYAICSPKHERIYRKQFPPGTGKYSRYDHSPGRVHLSSARTGAPNRLRAAALAVHRTLQSGAGGRRVLHEPVAHHAGAVADAPPPAAGDALRDGLAGGATRRPQQAGGDSRRDRQPAQPAVLLVRHAAAAPALAAAVAVVARPPPDALLLQQPARQHRVGRRPVEPAHAALLVQPHHAPAQPAGAPRRADGARRQPQPARRHPAVPRRPRPAPVPLRLLQPDAAAAPRAPRQAPAARAPSTRELLRRAAAVGAGDGGPRHHRRRGGRVALGQVDAGGGAAGRQGPVQAGHGGARVRLRDPPVRDAQLGGRRQWRVALHQHHRACERPARQLQRRCAGRPLPAHRRPDGARAAERLAAPVRAPHEPPAAVAAGAVRAGARHARPAGRHARRAGARRCRRRPVARGGRAARAGATAPRAPLRRLPARTLPPLQPALYARAARGGQVARRFGRLRRPVVPARRAAAQRTRVHRAGAAAAGRGHGARPRALPPRRRLLRDGLAQEPAEGREEIERQHRAAERRHHPADGDRRGGHLAELDLVHPARGDHQGARARSAVRALRPDRLHIAQLRHRAGAGAVHAAVLPPARQARLLRGRHADGEAGGDQPDVVRRRAQPADGRARLQPVRRDAAARLHAVQGGGAPAAEGGRVAGAVAARRSPASRAVRAMRRLATRRRAALPAAAPARGGPAEPRRVGRHARVGREADHVRLRHPHAQAALLHRPGAAAERRGAARAADRRRSGARLPLAPPRLLHEHRRRRLRRLLRAAPPAAAAAAAAACRFARPAGRRADESG